MEKQVHTKRNVPNKYVYAVFLASMVFFVCMKDYSTAIIFGGLGLAFEPFDTAVPFQKRPLWQRAWLLVHCLFVLIVLGIELRY